MSFLNNTARLTDKTAVQLLFLFLVCIIVYSNTFTVPFAFDDDDSIVQKAVIRNLDNYLVNSRGYKDNPSRYIGYLTFSVNYRLGGLNVFGYHLFNLLVHCSNTVLVYYLVLITFRTPYLMNSFLSAKSRSLSFITASLFAVHPVQTQAVTYIVQRFTSLAVLFYMISILCYIKARLCYESGSTPFIKAVSLYLLSLAGAILAMKTKEISFTLPLLVTLYEFSFLKGDVRKRAIFLVPILFTLVVIPHCLLSGGKPWGEILSDAMDVTRAQTNLPRWDYLMTQFCVIATYIRLLFIPYGQNLDYNFPIYHSFFTPRVFLSFLFLSVIIIAAFWLIYKSRIETHRHLRLISYGILWFFITQSVESSVIPIADVIFEHRIYLPSIGAFIAVVIAGGTVSAGHRMDRMRKIVTAICFLVIILLSVSTLRRNAIWGSSVSLWEDVVKKSPGKARPLNHLGIAYSSAGRNDDAVRVLVEAIRIDPEYARAYVNLGISLSRLGLQDDAENMFLEAIRLNPAVALAYYNLGSLYLVHQGKYEMAIEMLRRTVALNPDHLNSYINIAAAYNQMGEYGKALEVLENSIPEPARSPEACYNLGFAYYRLGKMEAANRQLDILRKKDPGLASRLEMVLSAVPRGAHP